MGLSIKTKVFLPDFGPNCNSPTATGTWVNERAAKGKMAKFLFFEGVTSVTLTNWLLGLRMKAGVILPDLNPNCNRLMAAGTLVNKDATKGKIAIFLSFEGGNVS